MMKPFEYVAPASLREALEVLERYGGKARPLAGGTDLFLRMERGGWAPEVVVDLKGVPGLADIRYDAERGLGLGALALHADVAAHPVVREKYPALAQGAGWVGGPQMRNRGTVGGNLCNASPAADTAAPLLALDARVRLVGARGERTLPLEGFFTGPGQTVLAPGEILAEVLVPPAPARSGGDYQRRTRTAMDIALVGAAAVVALDGGSVCHDVRIALASVAPTPLRAKAAEAVLRGKGLTPEQMAAAARAAAAEARPIDDVRATAAYRRAMVEVLARRALANALSRARGTEPGPPGPM
jgi:carbon-monoxide dehydrogenase medium subunit